MDALGVEVVEAVAPTELLEVEEAPVAGALPIDENPVVCQKPPLDALPAEDPPETLAPDCPPNRADSAGKRTVKPAELEAP